MKYYFPIVPVALILGLSWLMPVHTVSAATPDACGLYTKSDAEALFKEAVSDGVSRKAMFPAGETCRYTFSKNGDNYGLKLRLAESTAIKKEGIHKSAADVMARQKQARRNNPTAAKSFQEIPNLGDDAFWNGSDLWLLKGETLIIISVNSPMKGSFQNMEALKKARAEQDLALSLKVAESIVGRLK